MAKAWIKPVLGYGAVGATVGAFLGLIVGFPIYDSLDAGVIRYVLAGACVLGLLAGFLRGEFGKFLGFWSW